MDQAGIAEFLRARRAAIAPEDVGLPRGPRRRTAGLRREEVAALSGMSPDYYARIERGDGQRPSEQMLAALARTLRLSLAERDHLFLLGGYAVPARDRDLDHVSPGLQRVMDRLQDTAAEVVNEVGVTLLQTPPAQALLGRRAALTGDRASLMFRWFTEPSSRGFHPREHHERHGRVYVAQLRERAARRGPDSAPAQLAARLRQLSPEFEQYWSQQQVGLRFTSEKTFLHPEVGSLVLTCQLLLDPDQEQTLIVYTATPGSEDAQKLELLSVLGPRTDVVALA